MTFGSPGLYCLADARRKRTVLELIPATPERDLETRSQIHDLVVDFYREIVFDDLLGPMFDEVAEVDWAVHIPRLIDYWCRVLLAGPRHDVAILGPHRRVHELEAFTPRHFDRWYLLFVASVDKGWAGPIAERAKGHAARMATTLSRQLSGTAWTAPAARS
jgi:hemoglobin